MEMDLFYMNYNMYMCYVMQIFHILSSSFIGTLNAPLHVSTSSDNAQLLNVTLSVGSGVHLSIPAVTVPHPRPVTVAVLAFTLPISSYW